MITMLISDENVIAMHYLKSIVENQCSQGADGFRIKCFEKPEKLLEHVKRYPDRADIVFLDLGYHKGKELEIAREVHRAQHRVQLVFTSRKGFFRPEIYEVPHVYYLDKPIRPHLTALALERARNNMEENKSGFLPVTVQKHRVLIRIKDILYLEKNLRKILIHTKRQQYEIYGRFSELESYLKEDFLQCHQSYMVNLNWIKRLEDHMIYLNDEQGIPVSQRKWAYVKQKTENFLAKDWTV